MVSPSTLTVTLLLDPRQPLQPLLVLRALQRALRGLTKIFPMKFNTFPEQARHCLPRPLIPCPPFLQIKKETSWSRTQPSSHGSDIYGQISDPSGNDVTSPFVISAYGGYDQNNSASVGLPNGNHAVFWNGTDANSGGEIRSKGQILSLRVNRLAVNFLFHLGMHQIHSL